MLSAMNHRSLQGFTRRELLVSLVLVSLLAVFGWSLTTGCSLPLKKIAKASTTAKTGQDIYTMLSAWASDNNGDFPTARQFSNEAFRELFKARLVDSEKLFAIPGDAWHKNTPSGDGRTFDDEIGSAPDYVQALMPGECAWAYLTGLKVESDPQLPLLANGFNESPGLYTDDASRKGGVFLGEKCAWVTVSGSAKASELSPDFRLREIKDGQKTDVFSKAWGTNPDNIKNPGG
jgi:hypothetical protein